MLHCNIFSLINITLGLNINYIWIANNKKRFGKMGGGGKGRQKIKSGWEKGGGGGMAGKNKNGEPV